MHIRKAQLTHRTAQHFCLHLLGRIQLSTRPTRMFSENPTSHIAYVAMFFICLLKNTSSLFLFAPKYLGNMDAFPFSYL